jgi:hypothetical protein
MTFARFFVTTNNALFTTTTKFGVAGHWMELPDCFPPIMYVQGDSAGGINQGLYWLGHATTAVMSKTRRLKVLTYEPATKWFRTTAGIGPGIHAREIVMFYRALGEGPGPSTNQI